MADDESKFVPPKELGLVPDSQSDQAVQTPDAVVGEAQPSETPVAQAQTPEQTQADFALTPKQKATNINRANETKEINDMVNKGILSREEASIFDFESEIEIPEGLIQKPARVSERLRAQIQSKFTSEDFRPENVRGRLVHGTSYRAIRPLWTGSGKVSMVQGEYTDRRIEGYFPREKPEIKGRFEIVGEGMTLSKHGFEPRYGGKREISESEWPIYIVGEKYGAKYGPAPEEPCAIVLALWEKYSIENVVKLHQDWLRKVESGIGDGSDPFYLDAPFNYLVPKTRELRDPKIRDDILERLKEENVSNRDFILKAMHGDTTKAEELRLRSLYYRFLRKNLSNSERIKAVQQHLQYIQTLIDKNPGDKIYVWGIRDNVYLTVRQMANYCSNIMARGVDKSKILPVYDWDGNLLWPKTETEDDK